MHRRRFKQQTTLQDRIAEWAPGPERDELLRKLSQAETAMHLEDWANSPGLAAAQVSGGDVMKDMKAHLERLRDQAAECAILSAEAQTRKKRELFAKLCADLTDSADHIESVINGTALPDGLLGRSTYEPYQKPDE
jgi:hypothetical protein